MNRRAFLSPPRKAFHKSKSLAHESQAGLEPYTGSWTRDQAAHLIRRTGFGAIKRDVDRALLGGTATAAVNRIIDTAIADPIAEAPTWYARSSSTGTTEIYELQHMWFEAMRTKGFIEKVTLFWHNHFVTQWAANQGKASNSVGHLTYDYYKLLRFYALGNFKSLVFNMGLNPAMLIYLDGFVNEKGHANENYGRELLELFTMGQYGPDGSLNYTEQDIKEIAKALTGWVVTSNNKASFVPSRHNQGNKTYFGQTGTFGYDDVIDHVFELRDNQIAHFICRKLYCFFVQSIPDEAIVAELAQIFTTNNFEIAPVLRTLLSSAHFYDPSFVASRIKSPVEMLIGFLAETELTPNRDLLEGIREALLPINLNQELFNPPNVAGWPGINPPGADGKPGHYTWLTTRTLPDRWRNVDEFLAGAYGTSYDPFALAQKVSDPSDPFRLPTDLADTLLPVPLQETGVFDIDEAFGGDPDLPPPNEFLSGPKHSINLTKIMLNGTPHYEWPRFEGGDPENVEEARELLVGYMRYLIQLPEYQLT